MIPQDHKRQQVKIYYFLLLLLLVTNKFQLMTATEWEEDADPSGWYITEKYDGMRLCWNGKHFYSRHGHVIKVPNSITNQLPSIALDGELWTQYGLYQDAVNLCKSSNEEKWNKATFWVFDIPELGTKPLEVRKINCSSNAFS